MSTVINATEVLSVLFQENVFRDRLKLKLFTRWAFYRIILFFLDLFKYKEYITRIKS